MQCTVCGRLSGDVQQPQAEVFPAPLGLGLRPQGNALALCGLPGFEKLDALRFKGQANKLDGRGFPFPLIKLVQGVAMQSRHFRQLGVGDSKPCLCHLELIRCHIFSMLIAHLLGLQHMP